MTKKTPEQQAREMLDRMDVEGALEMTAGDVGELAQVIAERSACKMKLEGLAAHAVELRNLRAEVARLAEENKGLNAQVEELADALNAAGYEIDAILADE